MIYFIAHNLSLNRSYYLVLFFTDMCFVHLTIGWDRTDTFNGHLSFNSIYAELEFYSASSLKQLYPDSEPTSLCSFSLVLRA
jgi:hypothetical protein